MATLRTLLLAALLLPPLARGGDLTIRSDYMLVRCDTNTARISIFRATQEPLLSDVLLGDGTVASVRLDAVTNKVFGIGRMMEITHSNGSHVALMVFPDVPFVLIKPTLRNHSAGELVTNKVPVISALVSYFKPGTALKVFGTGGLLDTDRNPGSYAWQAVVEPEPRRGLVFGWLTHDRGSGVLFTTNRNGVVEVSARLDYGNLRLPADKAEDLETLMVGHFSDCRLGLEDWADAVAKMYNVHLPPEPAGYCTWYSRPHGGAADEAHIEELAGFAETNLAPFGFSVVQVDDGWQAGASTNGPKRNFTTHRTNGPYPHGMAAAASAIRSHGLVPGIWFMPFAGTWYDPFFSSHPEWFVHHASGGKPYETAWGGTCLDMTQAGARAHLSNVVHRITHEWGYGYLKIDGLWTGTATRQQYVNSGYREDSMGDAVFADPDKTNVEAYRDGLRLLRQAAGTNVFILGCNGPQNMRSYGGAFGLLDGMRIGPDNGAGWKSLLRGPQFGSRHYFLHRRIWYNDPDPVYVRADMPVNEAQLICSWVAISGQLNLSSEWLPSLPLERLEILRRTMPSHQFPARPVDLFENDPPRLWLVSGAGRAARRDVVGVFNWTDSELMIDYPMDRIGLDPFLTFNAFDYWQNKRIDDITGRLRLKLPPHSCSVLSLRLKKGFPQVLSTSRHVTQGMVDLSDERWDENARVLRGRSEVVAGHEYELRIVSDARVRAATIASPDEAAGARIETAVPAASVTRLAIHSPVSRTISWSLQFE